MSQKKTLLKLKIKLIRYLRSIGVLKEPVRTYTYKGRTYPFYRPPSYATRSGRLYIKPEELFHSVKFRKVLNENNSIQRKRLRSY